MAGGAEYRWKTVDMYLFICLYPLNPIKLYSHYNYITIKPHKIALNPINTLFVYVFIYYIPVNQSSD